MTKKKLIPALADVEALLEEDRELLKGLMRDLLQEVLEAQMTEAVGAQPSERTAERLGHRAGYCPSTLTTRLGKLELKIPRDREERLSTELCEQCSASAGSDQHRVLRRELVPVSLQRDAVLIQLGAFGQVGPPRIGAVE